MLIRQNKDVFIRIYDKVGYITNKKNYSDRVVDKVGSVFLSILSREPQTLETLVEKLAQQFIGVDKETLTKDALEFYAMFEEDGFLVSGNTVEELDQKDSRFSYNELDPKTIKKDFTPIIQRAKKTTQDVLDEYFKNDPQLMSLQIELTSRCNERCVHCYIPHENKTKDIAEDLFYDVLKQCKDMGVVSLTLSGGEPMLHPHFTEFLRKAKEFDFAINILSNLTLLNDEILAEMKSMQISSVQVSLYSMVPEVHDSITKLKGSFYKTKNAILKLIENDIPLQISCPNMKQNKTDFIEVLNWANEHKVRAITDYIMMACYDNTTENLDNRLSLGEVEDVIKMIINNDNDYKSEIAGADFENLEKRDDSEDIVCGVCVNTINMVSNGNVFPCAGWQSYILGNVKETSLKEIWLNAPKVKFLRGVRKKDFPECQQCEDKLFCAMCMVRNANEDPNGDPFKINTHFCKVAALNKRIVQEFRNNQ